MEWVIWIAFFIVLVSPVISGDVSSRQRNMDGFLVFVYTAWGEITVSVSKQRYDNTMPGDIFYLSLLQVLLGMF